MVPACPVDRARDRGAQPTHPECGRQLAPCRPWRAQGRGSPAGGPAGSRSRRWWHAWGRWGPAARRQRHAWVHKRSSGHCPSPSTMGALQSWPAGAAGPVCGAANPLPTFSFFGFFCFLGAAPAGRRCGGRAPRLIARTPGVSRAGNTPCLPVGHSMLAAWHLLRATGRNAAVGAHIPRRSPPSVAAVAVFLGLPSVFCFLVTLTSCTTRSRRSVAGHQGWHTARASWLAGRQQGGFKCAASAAAAELPALCATASWPSLPGASCAAQPRLASSSTIWAPPSSSSLSLSLSLPSSLACTWGGGGSRGGQSACWAAGQHVAGHTVPLPEGGPRAHWRCCTALKAETPFQNWHMIPEAHAPNARRSQPMPRPRRAPGSPHPPRRCPAQQRCPQGLQGVAAGGPGSGVGGQHHVQPALCPMLVLHRLGRLALGADACALVLRQRGPAQGWQLPPPLPCRARAAAYPRPRRRPPPLRSW